MQWFDKFKEWGAKLLQRGAAQAGIAREFKDIFELGRGIWNHRNH